MEILVKDSGLVDSTRALCRAVTDQPDFMALKGKLDAFLADELLKFQFQQVNDMGHLLQMKQSQGLELKPDEIEKFETLRQEVMENPVAQGFLEAQSQLAATARHGGSLPGQDVRTRPPAGV